VIGGARARWAAEKELRELRGEGSRRSLIGCVRRVCLVAAVRGVRDHAARRIEEALDLLPLLVGVDAPADACDLDLLVHDVAVSDALDLHHIRLARGESGHPLAAFGILRRLYRYDPSHRVALRQRLADEQVHVGLQEAARAELDNREGHQV
jgi:hypothetical protein